jgi:hypothetical protein
MVDDGGVQNRYRTRWLDISLDDQLWHQALVTHRRQEQEYATVPKWRDEDERGLFNLIQAGILDHEDKPWESSTRSMRHGAAMADRLWALLEKEHTRVCGLNSCWKEF